MDVKQLLANAAYKNQNQMMQGLPGGGAPEDTAGKPSFSAMVHNAIGDAIDTGYKTEGVQMEAMAGKAELHELVTAIANADLTLQTVVAVRDRVISAYQDILRMPI
jgi:flagellar hook-basal body complex protein FliE